MYIYTHTKVRKLRKKVKDKAGLDLKPVDDAGNDRGSRLRGPNERCMCVCVYLFIYLSVCVWVWVWVYVGVGVCVCVDTSYT